MEAGSLLVVAIFVITMGMVLLRPRGISEAVWTVLGAVVMLAIGAVSPTAAAGQLVANLNVFAFFLGMMAITTAASASGSFDRGAALAARLAGGRIWLLYVMVFGFGWVVALFFSNDAAALVLTPAVYAIVLRLRLDPLPFMFAANIVANAGSLGLPVSNPVNMLAVTRYHIGLAAYLAHMAPAALAVGLVNLLACLWLFRARLEGRAEEQTSKAAVGSRDDWFLVLIGAGYLTAAALGWPLGMVAAAGGLAFLAYLEICGRLQLRQVASELSWALFPYLAGLLVMVDGLERAGITQHLAGLLTGTSSGLGSVALTAASAALGSNLINNIPMDLVMLAALGSLGTGLRSNLVYATLIGCDLGPNLTPVGSLSTMLWLLLLRRRGIDISTRAFVRVGLILTPIGLGAGILGLWLGSR